MTIKIYGASDDLVVVEGDISEEFSPDLSRAVDETCYLGVSDGTVFSVRYDREGCWRFDIIKRGSAKIENLDAIESDADPRPTGEPGYSDLVTLTADKLAWALCGSEIAKVKR